ncbi:hypothetical protein N7517_010001 [Penicillium concentricum]|uniref:Uncharacterized protein n=1 Tax=Penicillium concentricum TaxID=293559 RepID=A0A9W9RJP8_9EURO|nr:uncharacterized protein N7517_010001 [Penicillium concentricum]KAJ5360810.1 hypothetical protein N7517_010001 [Penicillium concentricum]
MYAARNSFAFDAIYWKNIDQRFFGLTCLDSTHSWKERLDILQPEERQKLDDYVDLKLHQMKTRVLAWDPDDYTLEYMAKIDGMDA